MAKTTAKKTAKPQNFTAFAMIDGTRKKVSIKAVSLSAAKEQFEIDYPGQSVPDLKPE
jgi:hypothetical protein